jgi:hypothetical protein
MCLVHRLHVLAYETLEHGEGLVGTGYALILPDGEVLLQLQDLMGGELSAKLLRIVVQKEVDTHPYYCREVGIQ